MYKVSVVKCSSYNNKEVRKALLESLKSIEFKFKKRMKVLIKPNLLSPQPPENAITTHPVIIEELCKILKEYNAKIYIGESSSYETNKAFEICGLKNLSRYAKVINFEGQEKQLFSLGKKTNVPLPKILFNVDLIINVAKLKTHGLTLATLCVKNLYGCIPGKLKQTFHKTFPDSKSFSQLLLSLEKIIRPQLNIIDGVLGIEGEGPGTAGKPIKANVIVASQNAIAADIVASEIMGFNPEEVSTNKLSGMKRQDIEIIGLKDLKLKFQKPKSLNIPDFMRVFYKLAPSPKIYFDKKKCKKCFICEKNCPVQAICLRPFPECSDKKCIRCLCCIEVCPNSAVELKDNILVEKLKKIRNKFRK